MCINKQHSIQTRQYPLTMRIANDVIVLVKHLFVFVQSHIMMETRAMSYI
jgi:hypothetical protein